MGSQPKKHRSFENPKRQNILFIVPLFFSDLVLLKLNTPGSTYSNTEKPRTVKSRKSCARSVTFPEKTREEGLVSRRVENCSRIAPLVPIGNKFTIFGANRALDEPICRNIPDRGYFH